MATSLVADRLMAPMDKVLGKHQTGFLKGRQMFDNVKMVQAAIDKAKATKQKLYIAFLDQEKAYDSVDHTYLWKALSQIDVPNSTIEVIKSFYEDATTTVMINRMESRDIKLERGVRQGDPLSCLLFNIVIEGLANLLMTSPKIHGIQDSKGGEYRSLSQWREISKIYRTYSRGTTATLNAIKTKILAINDADAPTSVGDVEVVQDSPIEYLGVPVGGEFDHSIWLKKRIAIQSSIARWENNYLSIRQRVTVTQISLASQLWHLFRCLPVRITDIAHLQKVLWAYVWGTATGQRAAGPIANSQAQRPIEDGGLNMIDLHTMHRALNMYWIQKLETGKDLEPHQRPMWYQLVIDLLTTNLHNGDQTHIKGNMITEPWAQYWNSRLPKAPHSTSSFWPEWIKQWQYRSIDPTTREQLEGMTFWFHPQISQGKASPRWGAECWLNMFEGKHLAKPVNIYSGPAQSRRLYGIAYLKYGWTSQTNLCYYHNGGQSNLKLNEREEQLRFRILFAEALWTLWSYRCSWSFNEETEFTEAAAVARYQTRVVTRYHMDRQQALDNPTMKAVFCKRWATTIGTKPSWIAF
ncbi:reverse transcriptase [Ascosphaera apis ARSEF 7405]|uniref:Reverse transcriptase n=1 Tax=Ascosphaera apis ARSEF 7405 TaxID=392613 RepID=A0A166P062_9EURO|nr:reverse transcriptase [Ascosphaera apis ARSEF 7405]